MALRRSLFLVHICTLTKRLLTRLLPQVARLLTSVISLSVPSSVRLRRDTLPLVPESQGRRFLRFPKARNSQFRISFLTTRLSALRQAACASNHLLDSPTAGLFRGFGNTSTATKWCKLRCPFPSRFPKKLQ